MPRNGDKARQQLYQAATELFLERGFDAVTTAQIAERAGLTERTYFRHFPDKREVLFGGETVLAATLSRAVVDLPAAVPPLTALLEAFRAVVPLMEANRPFTEPLSKVIAVTPALRERQAAKGEYLVEVLTAALEARGVESERAGLAAQVAWAVLTQVTRRWLADPADGLEARLNGAFRQLRALKAELDETEIG